ncbi:hypothetical protein D3C72_1883750 [compost metagenome]
MNQQYRQNPNNRVGENEVRNPTSRQFPVDKDFRRIEVEDYNVYNKEWNENILCEKFENDRIAALFFQIFQTFFIEQKKDKTASEYG